MIAQRAIDRGTADLIARKVVDAHVPIANVAQLLGLPTDRVAEIVARERDRRDTLARASEALGGLSALGWSEQVIATATEAVIHCGLADIGRMLADVRVLALDGSDRELNCPRWHWLRRRKLHREWEASAQLAVIVAGVVAGAIIGGEAEPA